RQIVVNGPAQASNCNSAGTDPISLHRIRAITKYSSACHDEEYGDCFSASEMFAEESYGQKNGQGGFQIKQKRSGDCREALKAIEHYNRTENSSRHKDCEDQSKI